MSVARNHPVGDLVDAIGQSGRPWNRERRAHRLHRGARDDVAHVIVDRDAVDFRDEGLIEGEHDALRWLIEDRAIGRHRRDQL